MYQPTLARFTSTDPLVLGGPDVLYTMPDMRSFFPMELHEQPYVYAQNNPVNRSDPSGYLSQTTVKHEWNDDKKCGYYHWETKWAPAANEQDGYIIQRVNVRQKVTKCGGDAIPFENPCRPSNLSGAVYGFTYLEMWRVKGGVVYYDVKNNPPTQQTGAWDDLFSNDGVPDTFGCHQKWGEAIFIPATVFRSLPRRFQQYGVPNAGELFAVCSSRAVLLLWTAWHEKYGKSATEKVQERTWDCCDCGKFEQENHDIGNGLRDSNKLDSDCGKIGK